MFSKNWSALFVMWIKLPERASFIARLMVTEFGEPNPWRLFVLLGDDVTGRPPEGCSRFQPIRAPIRPPLHPAAPEAVVPVQVAQVVVEVAVGVMVWVVLASCQPPFRRSSPSRRDEWSRPGRCPSPVM